MSAADVTSSIVPDPIEARGWRNLWFLRDGRSAFGLDVYETEAEARRMADRTMEFGHRIVAPGRFVSVLWGGREIPFSAISHHMQMPWDGK